MICCYLYMHHETEYVAIQNMTLTLLIVNANLA